MQAADWECLKRAMARQKSAHAQCQTKTGTTVVRWLIDAETEIDPGTGAGLATFNLGVEAGQFAVLALLVSSLALLMRRLPDERLPILVISLIIGHTGWHRMSERAEILLGYLQTIQA